MTIAHELGHTLGLLHGGGDSCNDTPNSNSVMNSLYAGVADADCTPPGEGLFDCWTGGRPPLDETNLDEHAGICGAPAWDWDGAAILETGVALDLNPTEATRCGGARTTLEDHDDWGNIDLNGPRIANGSVRDRPRSIACDRPAGRGLFPPVPMPGPPHKPTPRPSGGAGPTAHPRPRVMGNRQRIRPTRALPVRIAPARLTIAAL